MKKARARYNPDWKATAPTVWYIDEDGNRTTDESKAKNKIRRNRKFTYDRNSRRYIEIER